MTTSKTPRPMGADEIRYFPATLRLIPATGEGSRAEFGNDPREKGRIPVALSSEFAVERIDWYEGERYLEVLDHSPESINLLRAKLAGGLPLLFNHDTRQFCGKVEDITIDDDRVLRGWMRFSKAQLAQEARQDVLDDLRGSVSIGYRVGESYEQKEDPKTKKITRRFRAWEPLELSLVPVPADPTVGAGRQLEFLTPEVLDRLKAGRAVSTATPTDSALTTAAATAKENTMSDQDKGAAPAKAAEDAIRVSADNATQERMERVSAMAKQHGCLDKLPEWIEKRASVETVSQEINGILAARLATPVKTGPLADLPEKDARRFSYARALLGLAGDAELQKRFGGGLEAEIIDAVRKNAPHLAGKSGLMPSMLQQRAGLDSGTSTKGAELKFTQPGEFIDLLRNRAVVLKAGAKILSGLTGPVSFPRQTGAGTASWIAENPGSDTSTSNLLLGTTTLAMKTLMSVTILSKQLMLMAATGNVDAEQMVRNDIAAIFGLAIDAAAIKAGGSNQPSGILDHTGIGSVTLGANGGALTYAKIVDLETTVASANGDVGPMSYVTTPTQRGALKKLYNLNTTYGTEPVWGSQPDAGGMPQGVLNGYRAFATNQVPSNLTKGTATTICSALIYGAFEELLIGEWGAFDALVDPYTLAGQGMIRVVGTQFVDIAVRRYQAFAAIQDIV